MKRLILSVIVMAFAVAVQADDGKAKQCSDKEKAACASKMKVSKDDGACPFAKSACCEMKQQAKQNKAKQPVLSAPKAADTAK